MHSLVDSEYHQLFAKEELERKLQKGRRYSETDKALVDAFNRRSDILYLAYGAVQQDEG